jgi:hypothetical protein
VTSLRVWLSRLRGAFRGGRRDADLAEEIQVHLDRLAAEHVRRGMSPVDARLAARREFGGVDQVKETYRDQHGWPFPESLLQDARYAFRALRRSPGFTAIAVLTLALGISVNATVFTLINAIVFKGAPFDRDGRLLYIHTRAPQYPSSYPDFQNWRAQAKSFDGMAITNGLRMSLSDGSGVPENYFGSQVSANTFQLIGQRPIIGRDFGPSDETPGAAAVAILSYGLWDRRYERDGSQAQRNRGRHRSA